MGAGQKHVPFPQDCPNWALVRDLLTELQERLLNETINAQDAAVHIQMVYKACQASQCLDERWIQRELRAGCSSSTSTQARQGARQKLDQSYLWFGLLKFLKKVDQEEQERFLFTTLPNIIELALRVEENMPHAPLCFSQQQQGGSTVLSRQLIASILACSFLCLFPERVRDRTSKLNVINFTRFFKQLPQPSQVAKMRCVLHYFERTVESGLQRQGSVTFIRQVVRRNVLPSLDELSQSHTVLCPLHVHTQGLIEDVGSSAMQVDFANSSIGGGVLGRGRVQEEIRFSTCPELIAAMLFMEKMEENEAIIIKGFEQFSAFRGYAASLEFAGPFYDKAKRDCSGNLMNTLCAIDATSFRWGGSHRQYQDACLLREVSKALVGFSHSLPPRSLASVVRGESSDREEEFVTASESLDEENEENVIVSTSVEHLSEVLAKSLLSQGMVAAVRVSHLHHHHQHHHHRHSLSDLDSASCDLPEMEPLVLDDLSLLSASSSSDHPGAGGAVLGQSSSTPREDEGQGMQVPRDNQGHIHSSGGNGERLSLPLVVPRPQNGSSEILEVDYSEWLANFRRRSSQLSDLMSRRSSSSTKHSSEFSSDLEEIYETLVQAEKAQHGIIEEESYGAALTEYAAHFVTSLMSEGTSVAAQMLPGLKEFQQGKPPSGTVRPQVFRPSVSASAENVSGDATSWTEEGGETSGHEDGSVSRTKKKQREVPPAVVAYAESLVSRGLESGMAEAASYIRTTLAHTTHNIPDDVYRWFADKIVQEVFAHVVDELYFQHFTLDSRWRAELPVNREGKQRYDLSDSDSISSSSSSNEIRLASSDAPSLGSPSRSSRDVRSESSLQRKGSEKQSSESSLQRKESEKQSSESSLQRKGSEKQSSEFSLQRKGSDKQSSESSLQRKGSDKQSSESSLQRKGSEKQSSESSLQLKGSEKQSSESSLQQKGSDKQRLHGRNSDSCSSEGAQSSVYVSSPTVGSLDRRQVKRKSHLRRTRSQSSESVSAESRERKESERKSVTFTVDRDRHRTWSGGKSGSVGDVRRHVPGLWRWMSVDNAPFGARGAESSNPQWFVARDVPVPIPARSRSATEVSSSRLAVSRSRSTGEVSSSRSAASGSRSTGEVSSSRSSWSRSTGSVEVAVAGSTSPCGAVSSSSSFIASSIPASVSAVMVTPSHPASQTITRFPPPPALSRECDSYGPSADSTPLPCTPTASPSPAAVPPLFAVRPLQSREDNSIFLPSSSSAFQSTVGAAKTQVTSPSLGQAAADGRVISEESSAPSLSSQDLNLDCYRAAAAIVNQVFQSLPDHLTEAELQSLRRSPTSFYYHGRKYESIFPRGSYETAAAVIGASEKGNVVSESYVVTKVVAGVSTSETSSPRRTRSQSPCLSWLSKRLSRETLTNAFIKVESRPSLKSYERRSSEPCQRSVTLSLQAFNTSHYGYMLDQADYNQRPNGRTDDDYHRVKVSRWRRGSLDSISLCRRRSSCGFKDPILSRFAQELITADTSVPQLVLVGSGSTSSTTGSRRSSMSGFRDTTLATFESELLNSSFTLGQSATSPRHQIPQRSHSRDSRLCRSDSSEAENWFPIPRRVGQEFQEQMERVHRHYSVDDVEDYADFVATTILQQAVGILYQDLESMRQDDDINLFSENFADQVLREALVTSASLLCAERPDRPSHSKPKSVSDSELEFSVSSNDLTGRSLEDRLADFQDALDVSYSSLEGYAGSLADSILTGALEECGGHSSQEGCEGWPIASGNWGCGAFCGDPCLKVALQWVAASLAHCPRLMYFTFRDQRLDQLVLVVEMLTQQQWTVGQLMTAVRAYCDLLLQEKEVTDISDGGDSLSVGASAAATAAATERGGGGDRKGREFVPAQSLFDFLLSQP